MGYTLDIDVYIQIKRTEEQKKALKEEIDRLKNSGEDFGDVLSYDVQSKKKIYQYKSELQELELEPMDYFTYTDDIEIVSDTDAFIVINSLKEFYNIDFVSYKYENVPLEDFKAIIKNFKPDRFDKDMENVDYVREKLNHFINDIFENIRCHNIDDSRIKNIVFNFSLH